MVTVSCRRTGFGHKATTPNAEVKVTPDASHTAFLEQREPYMAVVREFFSRVAQAIELVCLVCQEFKLQVST